MLALAGCNNNSSDMQITQEWDKVFPLSEKVAHRKVKFKNRYGITLVGDLYSPKSAPTEWLSPFAAHSARQRSSQVDSMP